MNKIFKNIANQKVINSKDKKLSQDWGKGNAEEGSIWSYLFQLIEFADFTPIAGISYMMFPLPVVFKMTANSLTLIS